MATSATAAREWKVWLPIFVLALGFNVYGVTYHFTTGFMAGHEFRQAQTAVTSYYIDKDNNFGLLYETPILGKPWVGLLLEVPVYEWSVVGVSRALAVPQVVAARLVSAACFYLMLPALYLLLGRLGVAPLRRLLMLALVLTCPVYIYYSRAFLMDAMELMCCAWWLVGFVRTMDERKWWWLAVAVVAGTLAALIKSATLAIWLIPGAGYGAWVLWQDLRAGAGWKRPVKTLLWGLGTVVVALGLLRWWLAYTDPIKAAHPSAWIFTSTNLSEGNWGLFDLKVLLSAKLWHELLGCWEQAIMSRWLIAAGLIVGLLLPKVRWKVLGIGGVFFAAQLLFPFAYAYQDYYFYSCAVFLNVALGFMLLGLLEWKRAPWCAALGLVVLMGAEVKAYWQDYHAQQSVVADGGYPFTAAIRDLTPKSSVIIVAGADWAAMTPLYAQRRALMVRNGLEFDYHYLDRAFRALGNEDVSALVVYREMRSDRNFINMATGCFDMAAQPTFSGSDADIYISHLYDGRVRAGLANTVKYPAITIHAPEKQSAAYGQFEQITPERAKQEFANIGPGLFELRSQFGSRWMSSDGHQVFTFNPNADLKLAPMPDATAIKWNFGIFPNAYAKEAAHTDGVLFIIYGERFGGQVRRLYQRLLDPWNNPADRGEQHEVIPYHPLPGEVLTFSVRPFGNGSFDWSYVSYLRVN